MTFSDFMQHLEEMPPYKSSRLRRKWLEDSYERSRTHQCSMLTALLIRRLNADGVSSYRLADQFGISQCSVGGILRGESFRDLPGLKDEYVYERHTAPDFDACELRAEIAKRYVVPHKNYKQETEIRQAKRKYRELQRWLREH